MNRFAFFDFNKWIHNLLLFFAPVALMYLTQVIGVVQLPNHVVLLTDFIPSQFTIGAMTLYILNGLVDFIRKYIEAGRSIQ